ncbi:hypothetical protein M9458_041232, partial [Cirrhinus mrigala]
ADPRWSLKSYINFTLWIARSAFTVNEAESSPGSSHVSVSSAESSPIMAASPQPSQLPPCGAELPELTADREPEPAVVIEPSPSGATELMIAPEPEPQVSDQVRERAVEATVEAAVEITGARKSHAHCATAEGEQELDLGNLIDFYSEIPILLYSPELLTCENIPPNLLLPPPLIDLFHSSTPSQLDPVSPSAHPQPTHRCLEDPSTPPPASEAQTPPQSCNPAAPTWLPAPFPPAPLGSLSSPLPPPRDCTPPAAPRRSVSLALLGSSFPPGSPPTPQLPKPSVPPWPFGSSASPWLVGSLSPPGGPPPAPPPSDGPLDSSALPSPWLLLPSAPPWAVTMTVAWALPDSSCTWSIRNPPWFLPSSKPPWLSAGLPICPSPASRPPDPLPSFHHWSSFYSARSRLPGGGEL